MSTIKDLFYTKSKTLAIDIFASLCMGLRKPDFL
jgi:hypothetical protein